MAAAPETDARDELRAVARELLAKGPASEEVPRRRLAEAGWLGLEVPEGLDGAGVTFAETAVVLEELGRAAARTGYFGVTVLAAGTLTALQPTAETDALLRRTANGTEALTAALVDTTDDNLVAGTFDDRDVPFRIEDSRAGPRLSGHAGFVPDAAEADRLLLLALDPAGTPVVVLLAPGAKGLTVTGQPVLDATRRFALVRAEAVALDEGCVLRFDGEPRAPLPGCSTAPPSRRPATASVSPRPCWRRRSHTPVAVSSSGGRSDPSRP